LYAVDDVIYNEQVTTQIEAVQETKGQGSFHTLLHRGETWEIH